MCLDFSFLALFPSSLCIAYTRVLMNVRCAAFQTGQKEDLAINPLVPLPELKRSMLVAETAGEQADMPDSVRELVDELRERVITRRLDPYAQFKEFDRKNVRSLALSVSCFSLSLSIHTCI